MEEPIMDDERFARAKLERAKRLALIFDQLDSKSVKEIFSCIYQAMLRLKMFNEKFYFIQDLLQREFVHYGGIAKAYSWKDAKLIRKWEILELINQIESEMKS